MLNLMYLFTWFFTMQVVNKMKNFWKKIKIFFPCFSGMKCDNEDNGPSTATPNETLELSTIGKAHPTAVDGNMVRFLA